MKDWKHRYFDFDVIRCRQCGFIRAKTLPSELDLLNRYKTYTYRNASTPDIVTVKRYEQLLNQFEKYRKTNFLLDYGCGEGHFISIARDKNWNPFGYEISEKAIEIVTCKGLNILHSFDFKKYKGVFDVITCMEVIEHVKDVAGTLNSLSFMLREGGCIYITTPNIKSLSLRYLKNRGNVIAFPEHLNYFSTHSLRFMLKKSYYIKSIKTTGIIPYAQKGSVGQIVTKANNINIKAETKTTLRIIKVFINGVLSLFKVGDTIKIKAEKCQIM